MVFVVFRPFSSLFRALFEDRVGIVEERTMPLNATSARGIYPHPDRCNT